VNNSTSTTENHTFNTTRISTEKYGLLLILVLYLALGTAIRSFFILRADFPLNDGGMFYQMTRELENNRFILPAYTNYNLAGIPYAYPPLPFYLAGVLETGLNIDLLRLELILPVAFNVLAILAFFDLSRQILKRDYQALHATLAFAIIPPAYEWLIMGGGLARSPAYLFSILALGQFFRAIRTVSRKSILLSIFFTSLTGYCHLEVLWVAVIFMVLAVWFLARHRKGWLVLIITCTGMALLLSPYVIYIIHLHGIQPFIIALQSGKMSWLVGVKKLLLGDVTGECLFTPILVFAILGFGRTLQTRNYLLTAWTLATLVFDTRSLERTLVIPLCLFFAIGLDEVVLPGMANIITLIGEKTKLMSNEFTRKIFPNGISAFLIAYMMIRTAIINPLFILNEKTTLHSLPPADRQAMQWISKNTELKDSFLLLSSPSIWQENEWTEWFPVLAQRSSILTVQGSEWLPNNRFLLQEKTYQAFMSCVPEGLQCIERTAQSMGVEFTHVFISSREIDRMKQVPYTLPIANELHASPDYQVLYDQDGVAVYRKIP
jgi:hypothetical protein